ncbi:type I-C CRISPR-associated protein Cas5 [Chlorobaculum sp. 24CR]|uniref:type I-C CRISPR-associated protein Cas5c n=1 Tax=Chlorobaculum sp. 24CR TaxID=2508878 RepID=UPI00100BEDAA|nr:type I-C CRISPR-associated protein Cas5c [Chlorobaculum sp. 24CR]RXK87901.1 type I-C CRISPR-associated protein Cas5 [Chlorobaculum sp. 24CR]
MEYFNRTFCLEVKGDFACFTRPEMKVERVSYDVITPSAARAVFEAIFWKPAVKWRIRKIDVLRPIKWISVRRNELGAVMSDNGGIYIDDIDNQGGLKHRQQRSSLLLRDVAYRLHAELEFIPPSGRTNGCDKVSSPSEDSWEKELLRKDENPGKYYAIFERRARKGQCFNQPYLGCREFSCAFRYVEDLSNEPEPINETRDLGFMLYDLDFKNPQNPMPAFFRAKMSSGIIDVPDWESEEVKK